MQLRCGSTLLDLTRPKVMGVLNVTPDSFSDGLPGLQVTSVYDFPSAESVCTP